MSETVDKEKLQVCMSFIHEILAMSQRFGTYVADHEMENFLTVAEHEFKYQIAVACQRLIDTQQSTSLEERIKK